MKVKYFGKPKIHLFFWVRSKSPEEIFATTYILVVVCPPLAASTALLLFQYLELALFILAEAAFMSTNSGYLFRWPVTLRSMGLCIQNSKLGRKLICFILEKTSVCWEGSRGPEVGGGQPPPCPLTGGGRGGGRGCPSTMKK